MSSSFLPDDPAVQRLIDTELAASGGRQVAAKLGWTSPGGYSDDPNASWDWIG
ncbi:hypothetical protein ACFXKW_00990 [Streptomyces sp. NPDC059193]|uniref:hypothetical protein n=1 Tax=Streptomyces sp. NPDC059193 TaxID=3346763 RepID=UPI00368BC8CB